MAALAAFDPDAVVAVLPSDHVVEKRGQFRSVLIAATAAAERGYLVTIGITPTSADTGFGYIEAGDRLDIEAPVEVRAVKRFVEKPKPEAAEKMVADGGHFWNAGMFVWRVEEVLRAFVSGARGTLPETLVAIVQKRLEALDEGARRVLRAASVFGGVFWRRAVAALLDEAMEIVRSTQREDGRWTLQNRYKGKTYFELERLGAPSRWNTLRALRVLKWWDGAGRREPPLPGG